MTNDDLIAEASHRLADAAPDAKVILFGSHARGHARSDSDLDLVVVPTSHVDECGHFEGTMLNDALREGRVLVPA